MRAKLLLASLVFVFLLSVAIIPAGSSKNEAGPGVVKVGAWINSIEKVDTPAQTFTVDFYLWFKYRDIKPDIEFLRGTPRMDLIVEEERETEKLSGV